MNILKNKLSPIPFSLTKEMNLKNKSELISILMSKIETGKNSRIWHDDFFPQWYYQTFGDYAIVFFHSMRCDFRHNKTWTDIMFDHCLGGNSIKYVTRTKRIKNKRIQKLRDRTDVSLSQVWRQFVCMDKNKLELAHFLSEMIILKIKTLHKEHEMVIGGRLMDYTESKSTRRSKDECKLDENQEKGELFFILKKLLWDIKEFLFCAEMLMSCFICTSLPFRTVKPGWYLDLQRSTSTFPFYWGIILNFQVSTKTLRLVNMEKLPTRKHFWKKLDEAKELVVMMTTNQLNTFFATSMEVQDYKRLTV